MQGTQKSNITKCVDGGTKRGVRVALNGTTEQFKKNFDVATYLDQ